jgi:hypothetical protein
MCQSRSFKGDPSTTWGLRRRTEITPVKDSHTRIKALALTNGHGRYITVTPERTLVSVGEWPLHICYSRYRFLTVSLPKRFRNGRFGSETATQAFACCTVGLLYTLCRGAIIHAVPGGYYTHCVRWGMAVTYGRYRFVTVSPPKRFRNGRFNSETAACPGGGEGGLLHYVVYVCMYLYCTEGGGGGVWNFFKFKIKNFLGE